MEYTQTWFSKHPITMHSCHSFGRISWMHHYVDVVDGTFVQMSRKNTDGSIDVLGMPVTRLSSGLSFGGYDRKAMQRSLSEHAEKLTGAGAKIVKRTRNKLVVRYGKETAVYEITNLTARTYFGKLRED